MEAIRLILVGLLTIVHFQTASGWTLAVHSLHLNTKSAVRIYLL